MKNQKTTHHILKKAKKGAKFNWQRRHVPADEVRNWPRVHYSLSIDLLDGRVLVNDVVFGENEPRRVLARRLRYTKMVLLREARENG